MAIANLHDLYLEQLKDLYSAENQLVEALPLMAKAASTDQLRKAFENHLTQTQNHVKRLEQIFEMEGSNGKGKKCKAMAGLIAEGQETIDEPMDAPVKDAALIAAGQRVEHYEIAGYGTVRTYAQMLGSQQAVDLLQMTLDEEADTDKKLTALADTTVNKMAAHQVRGNNQAATTTNR